MIPITEVNDPVFSGKMMGDGFAVIPETGTISSPCDGEIVNIFKTKHAIIIRSTDGLEIIIHVGLDTVQLKGEGFEVVVDEGQQVKAGELLLKVDLDHIKSQGKETVTPVVITNMDIVKSLEVISGTVEEGKDALSYQV